MFNLGLEQKVAFDEQLKNLNYRIKRLRGFLRCSGEFQADRLKKNIQIAEKTRKSIIFLLSIFSPERFPHRVVKRGTLQRGASSKRKGWLKK